MENIEKNANESSSNLVTKLEKTGENERKEEKIQKELEEFEATRNNHRKIVREITFEMEDLDEFHQKIAMKIGIEAYRELIKLCGGSNMYFPQYSKLVERKKKEYVYNVFLESRSNYNLTANYCGLSVSTVRRYIREYKKFLYDRRRRKEK